jgi:hypothetical protein
VGSERSLYTCVLLLTQIILHILIILARVAVSHHPSGNDQGLRVHNLSATSRLSGPSPPSQTYSSRPYPLQLDTALQLTRPSPLSTSPDGTSMGSARRSSTESAKTVPKGTTSRKGRTGGDRSMSMSVTSNSIRTATSSLPPILPPHEGRHSPNSVRPTRRTPIVYPALLSRVAEAFRERIPITDRLKDGLTYKDAFDGREAVDKIAYIIKTTDRNLALLLGRALDAQKFFHDVTYDHRLRDSANELYQFRTRLPSPFVSGELPSMDEVGSENGRARPGITSIPSGALSPDSFNDKDDATLSHGVSVPRPRKGSVSSDDVPLPSGVFTLLTDCYSPTCSRDQLCYSIACPRRLEQQSRLNMKPQPGLTKQISRESLGDVVVSSVTYE